MPVCVASSGVVGVALTRHNEKPSNDIQDVDITPLNKCINITNYLDPEVESSTKFI